MRTCIMYMYYVHMISCSLRDDKAVAKLRIRKRKPKWQAELVTEYNTSAQNWSGRV